MIFLLIYQLKRAFLKLYGTPKRANTAVTTFPMHKQNDDLCSNRSTKRTTSELRPTSLSRRTRSTTSSTTATAMTSSVSATTTSAALSFEGIGSALCSRLQRPLVTFDQTACLIAESQCQALQSAQFNALPENNGRVDLVKRRG